LGGISDFICAETSKAQAPIVFGANFSMELIMISRFSGDMVIRNYSKNIEELIEETFEYATNYTLTESKDFNVTFQSVNATFLPPAPIDKSKVLIKVLVRAKNSTTQSRLMEVAEGSKFAQYLNDSFNDFFAEAEISINVYSIAGVILNITSTQVPETTGIFETTGLIETSTGIFETTGISETSTGVIETTINVVETTPEATAPVSEEETSSRFKLVPWMIAVIVIAAVILVAVLIGICAACMTYNTSKKGRKVQNNKESVPMIATGDIGNQAVCETGKGRTRVPDEEDEVYV
jgi:hypothetical protein